MALATGSKLLPPQSSGKLEQSKALRAACRVSHFPFFQKIELEFSKTGMQESSALVMNIIIFKAGRMIGPLDRESVNGMLARGEVSENDLAQRDGLEVWIPLRRMFPSTGEPGRFGQAWNFARVSGLKFWDALQGNPLRTGLASLLFGCALLIIPRWTFLFFVPALAAAVFAGSLLLTRHRFVSGSLLSIGALGLPALFLLAGHDDTRPDGPFQLFASPSIESVAPPKPVVSVKPTPRPTFQGVALPLPVQPTPVPRPVPAI